MKKIFIFSLLGLGFQSQCWANFEDMGSGVRSAGMANAFVGVADDASALHDNPAGIVQLKTPTLSTDYSQLLTGLGDNSSVSLANLRYIHPLTGLQKQSLGVAVSQFSAANSYQDQMAILSYGRMLPKDMFENGNLGSLGASLKFWQRKYRSNSYLSNALQNGTASGRADPLFSNQGYSAHAVALDLGYLHQFSAPHPTRIGLALSNLNQPDLSLAQDGDKAPLIARLGGSIRWPSTLLSLEVRRAKRISDSWDKEIAMGAEKSIKISANNSLDLRMGYEQGSRQLKNIAMGLSVVMGPIRLDYSFGMPLGVDSPQSDHRLSFTFQFNPSKPIQTPAN